MCLLPLLLLLHGRSIVTPSVDGPAIVYNENNCLLYYHVFEPDDALLGGWLIGRLVAPGNSEGLIEGLVLVAGTSMLSSVTAGSLLVDCVH